MSEAHLTPARRLLTGLVAPATVSTAILYYFGWLRSQTIAQQFGYEASLLGLGPQDYILRSVQPVGTLAIIGGAIWWPIVLCHRRLSAYLGEADASGKKRGELHWVTHASATYALRLLGVAASIGALAWTWRGFDSASYLLPGLFALAAAAVGYGTWLQAFRDPVLQAKGFQFSAEVLWTVTAIAFAGVFVLTSIYARQTGRDQVAENLLRARTAAVVTLVADEPLNLTGLEEITVGDHHITTGVTLMFTEAGLHFLLPVNYDPDTNARVYTIPVERARLDFDRSWNIPCAGFEDLAEGETLSVGDTFESGGAAYRVMDVPADLEPGDEPRLVSVQQAGDGLEIRLVNVMIAPVLRSRYDGWLLDYEQHASGVVIAVDHQPIAADTFPAVASERADHAAGDLTVVGGADGQVRIRGGGERLASLAIGGRDLTLDCEPNINT